MTDIERLRLVVRWAGYQNESVNQCFTTDELIRLWAHTLEKGCPYEFFDTQDAFDYAVSFLKKGAKS